MQAGMHGTGAVAESSHVSYKEEAEGWWWVRGGSGERKRERGKRDYWEWCGLLRP